MHLYARFVTQGHDCDGPFLGRHEDSFISITFSQEVTKEFLRYTLHISTKTSKLGPVAFSEIEI